MTVFLATPANSLQDAKAMRVEKAALRARTWHLHSILADPASTIDEAKRAKLRMLEVLEHAKRFPVPMFIRPVTLTEHGKRSDPVTLPDLRTACATCGRSVTPAFVRGQGAFSKSTRKILTRLSRQIFSDATRPSANINPPPFVRRINTMSSTKHKPVSQRFLSETRSFPPRSCLDRWENDGGSTLTNLHPHIIYEDNHRGRFANPHHPASS